jgi:predicted TIM-barrel fold metal-dependent hydrolase
MIIDIHAHTSNHKLWNLHTETATIADLEKKALENSINKIFLMATYFPYKKSGLMNEELLKRIRGNPLFGMFGSLNVMDKLSEGVEELKILVKNKMITGIKLYPGYQDFDCSDQKLFPLFDIAKQNKIPVMIHTGELHHCCPEGVIRCGDYCRLDKLADLSRPSKIVGSIRNFPEVNFILSHLSSPYCDELQDVMSKFSNVYTDISGLFISGREDSEQQTNEAVGQISDFLKLDNGASRILFGTDFPIQSYADSIALVKKLNLDKESEEKIFYKNALQLLNQPQKG